MSKIAGLFMILNMIVIMVLVLSLSYNSNDSNGNKTNNVGFNQII